MPALSCTHNFFLRLNFPFTLSYSASPALVFGLKLFMIMLPHWLSSSFMYFPWNAEDQHWKSTCTVRSINISKVSSRFTLFSSCLTHFNLEFSDPYTCLIMIIIMIVMIKTDFSLLLNVLVLYPLWFPHWDKQHTLVVTYSTAPSLAHLSICGPCFPSHGGGCAAIWV